MPLYSFEYVDDCGEVYEFDAFFSMDDDLSQVTSPCGKYHATKIIAQDIAVINGMTAKEIKAGTPKQRVEYGKFMRDQREIRKKVYEPGSIEHESNELWMPNTGTDGVTKLPVGKKIKRKKAGN